MADRMIESTRPGYHWAINCFKPHGKKGVAAVCAQEGVLEDHGGHKTFEYMLLEDRSVRDVIPVTRLTSKRKNELLDDLESRMREHGLID